MLCENLTSGPLYGIEQSGTGSHSISMFAYPAEIGRSFPAEQASNNTEKEHVT